MEDRQLQQAKKLALDGGRLDHVLQVGFDIRDNIGELGLDDRHENRPHCRRQHFAAVLPHPKARTALRFEDRENAAARVAHQSDADQVGLKF
jgi:hypothetical protein